MLCKFPLMKKPYVVNEISQKITLRFTAIATDSRGGHQVDTDCLMTNQFFKILTPPKLVPGTILDFIF